MNGPLVTLLKLTNLNMVIVEVSGEYIEPHLLSHWKHSGKLSSLCIPEVLKETVKVVRMLKTENGNDPK